MKNIVQIMPLAVFNASSLSSTLTPISSSGFAGPAILIRIQNDTDKDIGVSYNGYAVQDCILSKERMEINLSGTATEEEFKALFKKGTQVFVSGESGATGYIYMSVYYLTA